jgi:DNA-binding FadR family transcriptional regulator
VVYHLTRVIVEGQIPPGSDLPTEPELAAQFEVSRTVIREAIRVMVAKGMISVKQGSGMRVRAVQDWDRLDSAILFARISAGHDEVLLRELFETRRLIEQNIVTLACERRTDADRTTLRESIRETAAMLDLLRRDAVDRGVANVTLNDLDIRFHRGLSSAAQNGLLQQMGTFVIDSIRIRRLYPASPESFISNTERVIRDHERILAAVEAQDAARACEAMRAHIIGTEADVQALLLTATGAPS